ncbi:ubiquinol-cytochrome C chaperone [Rhodobacteraceae bacterium RKSG542]|uniref:ubiquinol-cytochrome C chaperone family protein n=1 Tax=Pseudovibrio flavus TaxID=2529854 RepID=UPI0012BBB37D|nr:ubiquinol-cytochrome C chaperone family protein [Pseudovibrio flavus]MTI17370.1 ubiquinol-cytochrome C chaperone [Pseudovibrio flavus]
MVLRFFRRRDDSSVLRVYKSIVSQARQPVFYTQLRVPDSVEGRFEMIVFHAFCVFHRLQGEDDRASKLAQDVFDLFFVDMDQSLREQGIGDEGVRRRIRKMSESFFGRSQAYSQALADGNDEALAEAFLRNIYAEPTQTLAASALVEYMHATLSKLGRTPVQEIMSGSVSWAEVPADSAEENC